MPAFVQHFAVDDVLLNALCYLIASVGDWGRGEQRALAPLGNRQSLLLGVQPGTVGGCYCESYLAVNVPSETTPRVAVFP